MDTPRSILITQHVSNSLQQINALKFSCPLFLFNLHYSFVSKYHLLSFYMIHSLRSVMQLEESYVTKLTSGETTTKYFYINKDLLTKRRFFHHSMNMEKLSTHHMSCFDIQYKGIKCIFFWLNNKPYTILNFLSFHHMRNNHHL